MNTGLLAVLKMLESIFYLRLFLRMLLPLFFCLYRHLQCIHSIHAGSTSIPCFQCWMLVHLQLTIRSHSHPQCIQGHCNLAYRIHLHHRRNRFCFLAILCD